MSNFTVYGFCLIVSASLVALISMSTDFLVNWVNDIVIPCQHDSVWNGVSCNCDNTRGVYDGTYCDECQCGNQGICSLSTKGGNSRWGCVCPSHTRWTGTLCDKCYAVDSNPETNQCSGPCISTPTHEHFGPKCDTVCVAGGSSGDDICREIASGGGVCNACNGHGTCSSTGTCDCDEGWFTTLGGEQCALSCETAGIDCPKDRGICTSIGGELQCICAPGYYGKDCDLTCNSVNDMQCSGHGSCGLSALGIPACTCDTHYVGDMCQHECPGDKSFPTSCSGHGACSVVTDEYTKEESAQCTCDKNSLWEGFDCSCNARFSCSGHGTCNEDATCKCNDWSEPSHQHFTGEACQKCKEHWYGTECHLRCDSDAQYVPDEFAKRTIPTDGVDIGCNGFGTCDVLQTTLGERVQCSCRGTDPTWFCSKCEANYYPLTSVENAEAYCTNECTEATCSFRGKCNDAYDGTNDICICDTIRVGTVEFDTIDPAQYCSTCKENWFPDQMDSQSPCTHYCASEGTIEGRIIVFGDDRELQGDENAQKVCSKNGDGWTPDPDCRVCSNKGVCQGDGECECEEGVTGLYCEIDCGTTANGQVCNGHGKCIRNDLDMWFDPFTEEYRCECQPYDTYTSETRQRLLKRGFQVEPPPNPQYYGKYCEFHCPRYNEEVCADRGQCTIGVTTPEKSDPEKGLEVGVPKTCSSDDECSGIPGAFCAQLSSPWDSLMDGTKSFFSSGPQSPGYFACATSQNCLDSIYSIPWDDYCVNMLNGWYPNVLNTASCTYHIDETANCREKIEDFFMSTYKDDKTWCESAMENMAPITLAGTYGDENATFCGPSSHASPEMFSINEELCHTWELETACNANTQCIYDKTIRYIESTDTICSSLTIIDDKCCVAKDDCPTQCQVNTDGTACETKTYCRAKNCQDAILDNNIESLCTSVEPACANDNEDWSSLCTKMSGSIRDLAEMSTKDTFYSCAMYKNSINPQVVRDNIPGGIDIYGELTIAPEDNTPVAQYRSRFLESRNKLDLNSNCGQDLASIDFSTNGFCEKHLDYVLPSWYKHESENTGWFREYMVICSSGIESIHSSSASAEDRAAMLKKDCTVEYKCQNRNNPSWETNCADEDSDVNVPSWTLRCLTSGDTSFSEIDWSSFPQDISDCTLHENTLVTRWGGTQWDVNDVIDKFTDNCKKGLDASFIPKETPIPRICDMGACAQGHTCVPCSESTMHCNQGVVCIAPNAVNCFDDMLCQNGGECFQPYFFESSNKYLCEWEHNEPVLAYIGGFEFNAELTSRNILVVPSIEVDTLPEITIVRNNSWSVLEEPNIFIGTDVRIPWTSSWENCTHLFCPITRKCVDDCSDCGEAHGSICSGQIVEEKSTSPVLPPNFEQCQADNDFNWYQYCSQKPFGDNLKTGASNGLRAGWSGTALLLSENKLFLESAIATMTGQVRVVIDTEASDKDASLLMLIDGQETIWHVEGDVLAYTDYVRTYRKATSQIEILHMGTATSKIELRAMFGAKLVLKSLMVDNVEQIKSMSHTLVDSGRFYMGGQENVTNFESWSFDADGTATIFRKQYEIHPPTKQCSLETTGTQMSKVCNADELPTNGQRWALDNSYQKRIHGWTRIQQTQKKVANMDVFNADFTPIVSVYVFQKKLYVNDVATECRIEPSEWWHWTIDMHAMNETHFVTQDEYVINEFLIVQPGETLFHQLWDIEVSIGDCHFSSTKKLVTTSDERLTHSLASEHFHHTTDTKEHECRVKCHAHEDCRQWSWTATVGDCFLHSTPCHEGACTLGAHTMHSFHARGISYFDIWSASKNTKVSWNHIRAEEIIEEPFTCPVIDIQTSIPEKWQESFNELYLPLEVDATAICNSLYTFLEPLPGYKTGHCARNQSCTYPDNDLVECATFIEHATPDISSVQDCENEKELFNDMDWTSYCRYERSFYNDIAFLGGRDIFTDVKNMESMCEKVETSREDMDARCSSGIDIEWYRNCFDRTTDYEEFCSGECINHIESMLDESSDSPSICTIRQEYLDISNIGLDDQCECSLDNIIVTEFCMSQNAYHVGNDVKIPELYNSACSSDCFNTLQGSMDRTKWRKWCHDLSAGVIPGTCAKTICECDLDNRGVAGDVCELSCPSGIDNGIEVACSGRNGRCFAVDEEQITDDLENQMNNGEFRDEAFEGPNLPVWQKGPSPTADGRCQCALGSGQACSIPCDKCNNGTYGESAASQFGMCDSFNGICRGLAPWMRYNFDKAAKEGLSSNTTAFETGLGVARWTYPDRFLFESDVTILDSALRYLQDPNGLYKAEVLEPEFEEEETMVLVFDVFEKLCWDEQFANTKYLDNAESISQFGLDITVGTWDFKTIELPQTGLCSSIEYTDDITLCYSNGEFHAMDKTERLIVIERGNSQITKTGDFILQGMSFTVHPDGDLYAFGGQWDYGTTTQKMNNMYRIQVRRYSWQPADILELTWSIVPVTGDIPPGQIYTIISASDTDIHIISSDNDKHSVYSLALPTPITPVGTWTALKAELPIPNAPINMEYRGFGQFYIHFVMKTLLFVPQSTVPFTVQSGNFPSKPLTVLSEKLPMVRRTCQLELRHENDTTVLKVAGQNVIRVGDIRNSITIYISEWINVDTSTKADLTKRFLETVTFENSLQSVDISRLTESQKISSIEMLERVYMHQARWISSEMMFAKAQISNKIWPDNAMFQHVPLDVSVFTPDFENVFDSLDLNFLSTDVQSSPSYLSINMQGVEPNRILTIQGNYIEEKPSYKQTFYIGAHKMEVHLEWSLATLRIRLSKKGDNGYIRWFLSGQPCRTFVLDVALEDWLRKAVDLREEFTYRHKYSSQVGRPAMFNLFTSREVSHTYSMLKQTYDFLAYSSSHCSITASQQCPGLLPYVNLPCMGRGRCNSACQCVCEVAPSVLQSSDTALQNVQQGDSPYRGHGCEITCPGFDGYDLDSICSGRGTCQYDGTCACPQGYTGDACQFKCPIDEDGKICSGHGGCGTRATEMASFEFGKNNYLDTITAINQKNYIMALESFYGPCQEHNYVYQKGEFKADINTANGDFQSNNAAFTKCESINTAVRQNARLNRDEEFRDYPYGTCIGVIQELPNYLVATLNKPLEMPLYLGSLSMFDCIPAECTFEPSETNDNSIRGLKINLMAPSFEIKMKYVHGVSSGTEHYLVNGEDFYISTDWTPHKFKITFTNTAGFKNNTIEVDESVYMFSLVIENKRAKYKVFKDYFPQPSEDKVLYLAPMFEHKYLKVVEELHNFVLIEDLPYLDRNAVEYACDMEPLCTGIIQWDVPFRENLFSLYAEVDNVEGFESFEMPENQYIFYKKMSNVYQGRESMTSKCDKISSKRAKYPTVEYTETYDIPIENIDLSLARDEETSAVVVGKGLWTQCWTKVTATTKTECYNKAQAAGTYGFAYSDNENVCLIYHKITDPTRIKLGRYNSESRLNIFHPCNSKNTYWRPIQ